MNHIAWALAFAFVGMTFAISLTMIFSPDRESPSVACVKAGGYWNAWGYCQKK